MLLQQKTIDDVPDVVGIKGLPVLIDDFDDEAADLLAARQNFLQLPAERRDVPQYWVDVQCLGEQIGYRSGSNQPKLCLQCLVQLSRSSASIVRYSYSFRTV